MIVFYRHDKISDAAGDEKVDRITQFTIFVTDEKELVHIRSLMSAAKECVSLEWSNIDKETGNSFWGTLTLMRKKKPGFNRAMGSAGQIVGTQKNMSLDE